MRSCSHTCNSSNWNATLGASLTLPDRMCLIDSADVKNTARNFGQMTLEMIPSSDFCALIKTVVVQVKYLALMYFSFLT